MKKIIFTVLFLMTALSAQDLNIKSVNLYFAQGIDSSLKYIIPDIMGGDINTKGAYITALSYTHYTHEHLINQGDSALQFAWEVIGAKHTGIQNIFELDILYFFKYARVLPPSSFLNLDFSVGDGVSIVSGKSIFDDGSLENPYATYNYLNYLMIDIDLYAKEYSNYHFFFRVHHRCGAYGLFAPMHVGSSFLGYGLRYFF